jgi:hypothetical protein
MRGAGGPCLDFGRGRISGTSVFLIWQLYISRHMAGFVAAIHLDTSYTPRPPHKLGIIRGLGLSQSSRDPRTRFFVWPGPLATYAAGDGMIEGYGAALVMPRYQPGYFGLAKKYPG